MTAEVFYTDVDKVRFWRGKAETIGGWEKAATAAFVGMARGLHSWLDTAALSWAPLSTHLSVLVRGKLPLHQCLPSVLCEAD